MVTVRRLGPDDWPLLRRVRLGALEDAPYAFGSTWDEELLQPDQWWKTSTVNLAWFVADAQGEPVGLAAGIPSVEAERWPEVISMWVHRDHRGAGVAAALMDVLVEWATVQGAPGLSLMVAQDNARARRFYELAGFRPTGRSEPLKSRPAVRTEELRLALRPPGGRP